jgi:DNA-binding NarL/FixJ family response regulator
MGVIHDSPGGDEVLLARLAARRRTSGEALDPSRLDLPAQYHGLLNERERAMVRALRTHVTNKGIATELGVHPGSCGKLLHSIWRKTGLTRIDLLRWP